MDSLITRNTSRLESSYVNKFILQVYGWMTFGLFATALVSAGILFLSDYSPQLRNLFTVSVPFVFLLELIIVVVLSTFWNRFHGIIALGFFTVYALLNGVFFGVIAQIYTIESIFVAFGATFLTFAVMSAYGYFTKSDLTKIRSLAYMALFGLIIGTFFNILISFINPGLSSGLYWILTYVGLGIFIVLVAADTQKLKDLAYKAENQGGNILNYSIQGALILYLDFINLFIRILTITGRRR